MAEPRSPLSEFATVTAHVAAAARAVILGEPHPAAARRAPGGPAPLI